MNQITKTDAQRLNDTVERAGRAIALAITSDASPGHDEAGGHVGSLTEATMGITAGLVQIAQAINNLADAVRETTE